MSFHCWASFGGWSNRKSAAGSPGVIATSNESSGSDMPAPDDLEHGFLPHPTPEKCFGPLIVFDFGEGRPLDLRKEPLDDFTEVGQFADLFHVDADTPRPGHGNERQ